ncbi:MAG: pilus assembly protein [Gemmatimonadota bacterium]|nr:pilus assembly protein [Gemmatimonadota bacterium]
MVLLAARKSFARLREEEGQATVEFALVLPVLVLLVVGIFEFGRAWNAHQVVTDAAREAARTAAVASTAVTRDSVKSIVDNALLRASLDPKRARVQIVGFGSTTGSPVSIQVEYWYRFDFLKPLMGWVNDQGHVTLSATSVMRRE